MAIHAREVVPPELLPPQNIEAERAVLGGCLISRPAILEVIELLESPHFYRPAHQIIFSGMAALATKREPVDLITLSNEMKRINCFEEVGGTDYLVELTECVPTAANVMHYSRIVYNRWRRRAAIEYAQILAMTVHEDGGDDQALDEVLARTSTGLLGLQLQGAQAKVHAARDLMDQFFSTMEEGPTRLRGHRRSTGFDAIDAMFAGFVNSDLVYLGGGPGSGKTTLAMQMAYRMALDEPVLMISMELGKLPWEERSICFNTGIPGRVLQFGPQAAWDEATDLIVTGCAKVAERQLYVAFGRHTTQQITVRAKELQARLGRKLGLIVTDRIEYAADRDCAHLREVERIPILSPRMKGIATELDVPHLCLVQLSRQGRSNINMEAFRASGAIEQDGQCCLIIESDRDTGRAIVHVVKQNSGDVGPCRPLHWEPKVPRFMSIDWHH
jgi:replicative DNA helicase